MLQTKTGTVVQQNSSTLAKCGDDCGHHCSGDQTL